MVRSPHPSKPPPPPTPIHRTSMYQVSYVAVLASSHQVSTDTASLSVSDHRSYTVPVSLSTATTWPDSRPTTRRSAKGKSQHRHRENVKNFDVDSDMYLSQESTSHMWPCQTTCSYRFPLIDCITYCIGLKTPIAVGQGRLAAYEWSFSVQWKDLFLCICMDIHVHEPEVHKASVLMGTKYIFTNNFDTMKSARL